MNPLTKTSAVLLLSRALSIYLFVWGCMELSYLPGRLFELSYLQQTASSVILDHMSDSQQFFLRYHQADVVFLLVRVAILFAGSVALYRCGATIRRFFEAGTDA
jgi:hypothetical protein